MILKALLQQKATQFVQEVYLGQDYIKPSIC